MPFRTVPLQASTTQTATGNSSTVVSAQGSAVGVTLRVSASSGTTPSLTLALQWSADGTNFGPAEAADAFNAVTANGVVSKSFVVKAPFYRAAWTISGTTPSFTFSVDGFETL